MTWRLDVAYQGTAYRGWARQPGHVSVEGLLEEALATVVRERVRLSVAGRTDAGVHAWAQVVSFSCARRTSRPSACASPSTRCCRPTSPCCGRRRRRPASSPARAASRSYRYDVWETAVKPVRERDYVWVLRGAVDGAALRAAAALLPGRRDFAALTPSAHLYHHCVREVTAAVWTDDGPTPDGDGRRWCFEITRRQLPPQHGARGRRLDGGRGSGPDDAGGVRGGAGLRRAPPHGPDRSGPRPRAGRRHLRLTRSGADAGVTPPGTVDRPSALAASLGGSTTA